MKYVEKQLGNFETVYIIPISDSHKGDRHFDKHKFKELISVIGSNDNYFGVLTGDLINNATKNSKSDVYQDTMTPQKQKKEIIEMLTPIQNKLFGATGGNHEDRTSRESGIDISEDIANALNIPYDPTGILYNVKLGSHHKIGKYNYTIYTTHGSGGGGTKGAKANKLHSLRNIVLADVYIMGHVHDIIAFPDSIYVPDTRHSKITKVTRRFCTAGSYLDWGGYAERLMLSPSETGFPVVKLYGNKKRTEITV